MEECKFNYERSLIMSRGVHFNHKKKHHPGEFPEHTMVERHTTEAQEDEEFIVTQEAFKNRFEEDEAKKLEERAKD
ncbi:hypothetical protein [Cytobacillus firmus]|uniref:hypothetical protein n=1 Tax=Cytobacillus firmus TaxID=1399 RepID=UPI002814CD67|nr:hypothetical protein [Cytobacillus firmus]MED1906188.1 hypothetical protein [Cytobacillus firmus]